MDVPKTLIFITLHYIYTSHYNFSENNDAY